MASFRSFVLLPDDIHREMSLFFRNQLVDVISLLSTCKYLYNADHLWRIALEGHRKDAPLPCPPGLDLSALSIRCLHGLAFKAANLIRNLSQEAPRPTRVTELCLNQEAPYGLLSVIPGTYLILVMPSMEAVSRTSDAMTCVECWDVAERRMVGSVDVDCQTRFSAPCMDVFGQFTIAASTLRRNASGEGEMCLSVQMWTVDYKDTNKITFKETLRKDVSMQTVHDPDQPPSLAKVALNSTSVAVFTSRCLGQGKIGLGLISLESPDEPVVLHDLSPLLRRATGKQCGIFYRGPILHLVVQDDPTCTAVFQHKVQFTFGAVNPYTSMSTQDLLDSIIRVDAPGNVGYLMGVATPFYGITEVCSRHDFTEGEYFFFPTPDGTGESTVGHELRVDHSVSHREEVIGPSGTILLRTSKRPEPVKASTCFISSAFGCKRAAEPLPLCLDLIRVEGRSGGNLSFSKRRLEMPKEIDPEKLLARSTKATQKLLLLDDALGVIYVILGSVLWSVSYS